MFYKRLILLLLLPILSQCADDGLSSKIDFAVIPDEPKAFINGISIPDNTGTDKPNIEVTGPFFQIDFTLTNNSDKPFVFQSIEFEILNDKNNVIHVVTINPIELDGTNNYFDSAIAPGGNFTLSTGGFSLIGYVDSLPEQANRNTVYRVKAYPQGWFGTTTVPTDNFDRSYFFITQ